MSGMVCTRPDIGYTIGVVNRYMSNPGKDHWVVVKWILQYLRGTLRVCLLFGSGNPTLEGYIDSDMSVDADTSRSTSGYIMTYVGGDVWWKSRLQKVVALSTTAAEYMAAAEAGKEIIRMKEFISKL